MGERGGFAKARFRWLGQPMAERAVEKEDAVWDEAKQKRWNELNERQQQGCLGDEEQSELDRLAAELERPEWAAL